MTNRINLPSLSTEEEKRYSEIVYCRRKPRAELPETDDKEQIIRFHEDDEVNTYIGASLTQNGQVRKGLTIEEEYLYLPPIINISPDDIKWAKETENYWNNLHVNVPAFDGLKLQVGTVKKKIANPAAKDAKDKKEIEVIVPINYSDYVLYKYLLVYNKCANRKDEMDKSTKITMYLYSEKELLQTKSAAMDVKRAAYKALFEIEEKEETMRTLLWYAGKTVKNGATITSINYSNSEVLEMGRKALKVTCADLAEERPNKLLDFKKYGKKAEYESMIERCISTGILTRIPNTNIIEFNGITLGNTMQEAVTYWGIDKPDNVAIVKQATAKLAELDKFAKTSE